LEYSTTIDDTKEAHHGEKGQQPTTIPLEAVHKLPRYMVPLPPPPQKKRHKNHKKKKIKKEKNKPAKSRERKRKPTQTPRNIPSFKH